jgi:hypothetical protein
VVTLSFHAHTRGRIDFEDLQGERSYSGAPAYNQFELANVLFTYELARRLQAHRSLPMRCTLAWCAPRSEPRTPPTSSDCSSRSSARS